MKIIQLIKQSFKIVKVIHKLGLLLIIRTSSLLASTSVDKTIKVWNLTNGNYEQTYWLF